MKNMPTRGIDTRQRILATAQNLMAQTGYTAVGLTEVLSKADVPKGSFYYYFSSKEAFGEALMKSYFTEHLSTMDRIASDTSKVGGEQLQEYWHQFYDLQSFDDCQGKFLVAKLAAEVSDLSEPMRLQLVNGIAGIINHLERMITTGTRDGSLTADVEPRTLAQELYDSWLGASVMAKVHRTPDSLRRARNLTTARLHL
jgi:TetR/AcrR family transcriptional repressor of nem operon